MRELFRLLREMSGCGSWPRFASLLALALLVATYKFVTDWPSLARLLITAAVLVGISLLAEILFRHLRR